MAGKEQRPPLDQQTGGENTFGGQDKDTNNLSDNQLNGSYSGRNTTDLIRAGVGVVDPSKEREKEIAPPAFPIDLLPSWLQKVVADHAESYGTPPELWATAFLCGISAVAGKKSRLITGNYINYPQLWVIPIGLSGTGKSDSLRIAFKPIKRINERKYAAYQQEKQDWEANNKQGRKPVWHQIIISDTTPEALFPAIAHSTGLTLYRDELSGWFADFGRYNKSGEVAHYLSIFNNNQVIINRKTDEPQLMNDPFLNICGTIQPGVLRNVLSRNNAEESGFAQRFLYLYPDFEPKKYKRQRTPPSTAIYEQIIKNIASYTGADDFCLSEEAEKEYEKFFNDSEARKYDGSDDFWAAVWSKAQIQVLRLALTIKVARLTEDPTTEVSSDDMVAAISIIRYCIASLKKFKNEGKQEAVKRGDVIRDIYKVKPDASPTIIGELFGISKQAAHKYSKVDRLTVDNSSNRIQERDTAEIAVNHI